MLHLQTLKRSFLIFLAALLSCINANYAQDSRIKEGDIVFQKLPCGSLCDAIIATTPCKPGMAFNHCGIIHYQGAIPFVIEAIGKAVKQTALTEFEKRDTERVLYIGRIRKIIINPTFTVNAVTKATKYIGTPYDDAFLPGDKALYCSELVWECYHDKNNKPVFELKPMTFRQPNTGTTFPAWVSYYKDLGQPVPEGVEGINPCAIANSDIIDFMSIPK